MREHADLAHGRLEFEMFLYQYHSGMERLVRILEFLFHDSVGYQNENDCRHLTGRIQYG